MNLYDIGDKIKVSSISGRVKAFNLFNTTVYNETDNVNVVIPNDVIGQTQLINYSR
jgi:small-conductance mechanosensitive channel